MDFKKEFKIVITQLHLIILFVIVVHFLLPFIISSFHFSFAGKDESAKKSPKVYFEVDLTQNEKLVVDSGVTSYSVESLEVINPDIYILQNSDASSDSISSLLSLLANTKDVKNKRMVVFNNNQKKLGHFTSIKRKERITSNKFKYATVLSLKELEKIKTNKLKKKITLLNVQFQNCYRDELYQDELLTGKMTIFLHANKKSVNFNGIGQSKSIINLSRCFKRVLGVLKVPLILQQKTIRFLVNLNGAK